MFQSTNPMFKMDDTQTISRADQATYAGISVKTLILILVAVGGGLFSRYQLFQGNEGLFGVLGVAAVVAFISVLVASISLRLAMPFSLLYAFSEGLLLGVLTTLINIYVPGAGTIAFVATASIFGLMYLLYATRIIKVTSRFRRGMIAVLLTILVLSIIYSVFFRDVFVANPAILIIVSAFLVIYGGLMLTLDFNRAEEIVQMGVDKAYEWRVALGLMVSIVWIYVQVLRLIVYIAALAKDR